MNFRERFNQLNPLGKSILLGGAGLLIGLFFTLMMRTMYYYLHHPVVQIVYLITGFPFVLGGVVGGYILQCSETTCVPLYMFLGNIMWVLIGSCIVYLIIKKKESQQMNNKMYKGLVWTLLLSAVLTINVSAYFVDTPNQTVHQHLIQE